MDQCTAKVAHSPLFLSLHFFFLLLSLRPSFAAKLCNPNDENVLLRFKTQLGNPPTLATYWTPNTDCCQNWGSGINCDDLGHVTSLTVGFLDGVTGPIPPAFGDLTFLKDLEFWNQNLSGPIPIAICKLTNLQTLTIRSTNMSGPIPDCLGLLKNLTGLEIALNSQVIGPIPKALAELPVLDFLQMPLNSLSGSIPDELCQLLSLQWVNFGSNRLTGSIPASLGLIPNLTVIDLSNNYLTGSIPESFGYFQNPITLQLNGNRLSGPIPGSMSRVSAYLMDFSRNELTGDASFLFGRNKTITQTINLSNNGFEFDFSYLDLPIKLMNLNVSHNHLYGSLPRRLGQLPLRSIDVSYNRLCGPIPTGRRLKRFKPIYFAHNKCLCGLPLPPCKVNKW